MRLSSFAKELLRSITRKPGRFLALLAIVALGAGFYAGLRMTAPDMKLALDEYFDTRSVYDLRVVGTFGLSDDDVDAIAELDGVEGVMSAYEADAVALFGEAGYTVRVHSLPSAESSNRYATMNGFEVVEGRLPENASECMIASDRVTGAECEIGDTIELTKAASNLDETFSVKKLTIVGKARSSLYVSSANLESSTLGSGVVQQVLFVNPDTFADSMPYTEVYVRVEGAEALTYGVDAEYDRVVGSVEDEIKGIEQERCEIRYDELRDELFKNATTYDGMLDLAEYRLSMTQDDFDNPEMPEWLVLNRSKSAGTQSFSNDSDRIEHIAQVFPFIFFLVAALVALTTMTRMVDEERMLIGTYKALGYSRRKIESKYLIYAALASVVGSLLGIVVLGKLLPGVIMNAYAIIYVVPTVSLPLDIPISLLSGGLLAAITLVATWFSIAATLRERPAALLLPKVASNGKRILLEHVKPIWSRLSFTWKVTFRNIFRYKKRFVMTVIGIAGCTALLLTGLGLHDAINDIIDVQYGEIVKHNAVVTLDKHLTNANREKLETVLDDERLVTEKTYAYSETMLASGPRNSDKRIDLVVPLDPEAFEGMKVLRTRVGHEPIELADNAVVLNEKMAQELGLSPGDTIVMSKQDVLGNATSTKYEFVITDLTENYIYNYLYMNMDTYERVVGTVPEGNSVYANATSENGARDELDTRLKEIKGVKTVSFNDETIDTYRRMLRSVDLIVVVLIISAAALAFIVLYNLTNINIEERLREIATLKVLGFLPRETNAYIFREIAIITLIGCCFGLLIGNQLESFVVVTAEVDQVMFGRSIHTLSYVGGFVLTLVFSGLAMLLMLPKLKRIDMVESLKSNE